MFFIIAFQLHAQNSDFKHIDFKKADSIALSYHDEELYNLPELAFNLTSGLETEPEKFRAIYKWVCSNISNNYGLYLKNKHKRERYKSDTTKLKIWNNAFKKTLFKKLLKRKTTICTGYAYLVKELAQLANIECEIVQGYGRVSTTDIENLELPNHSWNAVKLNNKWYLCDPTWASGIPNTETNQFTFQYNDGFFLAEPELFAVNHFPLDENWWLLEDNIPTFKDFLASPIVYGKAYEKLNKHSFPKQMHQNIKRFENLFFEYKIKDSIEPKDISFLIDNGSNQTKTTPNTVVIKDSTLKIEHQLTSNGFYDVHLYIKKDLISTYTFEVKN